LVQSALDASDGHAAEVDAYVARRIYGLTEDEYRAILDGFSAFSDQERRTYLTSYRALGNFRVAESKKLSAYNQNEKSCVNT
jgi:hypothetical protein